MSLLALVAVIMFMFIRTPYVPYGMNHKVSLGKEEDYFTQDGKDMR